MNTIEIDKIVSDSVKISKNRIELWVNILNNLNIKNVCEIGVFKGIFAEKMLDSIHKIESYTLVDPWKNLSNWNKPSNQTDEFFNTIRSEALSRLIKHKKKIKEIRDITKDAVKKINSYSLDFTYIDGDHSLRGITIDLDKIFDKVKEDGFIGGDDCTKNIWQHGAKFDPTVVFPYVLYFAEAKNVRIYLLPFNQFLIYKGTKKYTVIDHDEYMKEPISKTFKISITKEFSRKLNKFALAIRLKLKKEFFKSRKS